jgi:hypothetical protein
MELVVTLEMVFPLHAFRHIPRYRICLTCACASTSSVGHAPVYKAAYNTLHKQRLALLNTVLPSALRYLRQMKQFCCFEDVPTLRPLLACPVVTALVTVILTEGFCATDVAWRQGGTHACQFLFAPVLQQRMEQHQQPPPLPRSPPQQFQARGGRRL